MTFWSRLFKTIVMMMLLFCCFLIFYSPFVEAADNGEWASLNIGHGGPRDKKSLGFDVLLELDNGHYGGLGFYILNTDGGDARRPTQNYSIPHSNYEVEGVHKSSEWGVEMIYGFELTENLILKAKGGLSHMSAVEVHSSNVTHKTYEGPSKSESYGVYGVGLSKNIGDYFSLAAMIHNRRGFVFNIFGGKL